MNTESSENPKLPPCDSLEQEQASGGSTTPRAGDLQEVVSATSKLVSLLKTLTPLFIAVAFGYTIAKRDQGDSGGQKVAIAEIKEYLDALSQTPFPSNPAVAVIDNPQVWNKRMATNLVASVMTIQSTVAHQSNTLFSLNHKADELTRELNWMQKEAYERDSQVRRLETELLDLEGQNLVVSTTLSNVFSTLHGSLALNSRLVESNKVRLDALEKPRKSLIGFRIPGVLDFGLGQRGRKSNQPTRPLDHRGAED